MILNLIKLFLDNYDKDDKNFITDKYLTEKGEFQIFSYEKEKIWNNMRQIDILYDLKNNNFQKKIIIQIINKYFSALKKTMQRFSEFGYNYSNDKFNYDKFWESKNMIKKENYKGKGFFKKENIGDDIKNEKKEIVKKRISIRNKWATKKEIIHFKINLMKKRLKRILKKIEEVEEEDEGSESEENDNNIEEEQIENEKEEEININNEVMEEGNINCNKEEKILENEAIESIVEKIENKIKIINNIENKEEEKGGNQKEEKKKEEIVGEGIEGEEIEEKGEEEEEIEEEEEEEEEKNLINKNIIIYFNKILYGSIIKKLTDKYNNFYLDKIRGTLEKGYKNNINKLKEIDN